MGVRGPTFFKPLQIWLHLGRWCKIGGVSTFLLLEYGSKRDTRWLGGGVRTPLTQHKGRVCLLCNYFFNYLINKERTNPSISFLDAPYAFWSIGARGGTADDYSARGSWNANSANLLDQRIFLFGPWGSNLFLIFWCGSLMLDPSPFRSRGPDNSLSFFVLVGPRGSTNLLLWTLRIRSVLYSFYWTLRRSSYIVDQRIKFPFLIWTLRIQLLRGPRGSNFRRCLGPWGSSFMWTQRIQRSLYFGPRGSICFILDPEDPFKIFLLGSMALFRLIIGSCGTTFELWTTEDPSMFLLVELGKPTIFILCFVRLLGSLRPPSLNNHFNNSLSLRGSVGVQTTPII